MRHAPGTACFPEHGGSKRDDWSFAQLQNIAKDDRLFVLHSFISYRYLYITSLRRTAADLNMVKRNSFKNRIVLNARMNPGWQSAPTESRSTKRGRPPRRHSSSVQKYRQNGQGGTHSTEWKMLWPLVPRVGDHHHRSCYVGAHW